MPTVRFSLRELIGLVVRTAKSYYKRENFDRSDVVKFLELSILDLSTYATIESDNFYYKRKALFPPPDDTSDGLAQYDISSIKNHVVKFLSVHELNTGEIDVLDYERVINAKFSTEFNKQPVSGFLENTLYVYFANYLPTDVIVTYIARPFIPNNDDDVMELPDALVPLLVLMTVKALIIADGKQVPESLDSAIKEKFQLVFPRKG